MLFKSTLIISLLGFFSQFLGLIRDRLLASNIGAGVLLDTYYASFRVADFLYAIVLAFSSAVIIIPILNKTLINQNKFGTEKNFNAIFTFVFFLILILSILAFIFMPSLISFFAGEGEHHDLILFSRIMLIQPIFLSLSNLISAYAQAKRHFLIFSLAPIFYNLGIIFGILFLYEKYAGLGLIYGVIIGSILHFVVQAISLLKDRFRLYFTWNINLVKEITIDAWPRSIALGLIQIRQIIITYFAFLFGAGVLSNYNFAYGLYYIPVQIFAISYIVASFPKLSELYEKRDEVGFNRLAKKSFYGLFIFSIFSVVICFFGASFIAKIIYGSGANIDIINYFQVLSLSLPACIMSWYLMRLSLARRDAVINLYTQLISVIGILILIYLFHSQNYNYYAIPLAVSVIAYIEFLSYLLLYYFRHIKI